MAKELTDADYLKMNLSDLPYYNHDIHLQRWNDAHARAGNESTGRLANPVDDITQEIVDEASVSQQKEEAPSEEVLTPELDTMTVAEAKTMIAGVNSVDELTTLRKVEKAGRNRVGVLEALDARKAELSAPLTPES